MRFFFIIFLIFSTNSLAEIIEISSGIKIKIPNNKTYIEYNVADETINNQLDYRFTDKEISISNFVNKIEGRSGDEIGIHINSQKFFDFLKKEKDDFEILENDMIFDKVLTSCADEHNTTKGNEIWTCGVRKLAIILEDTSHYSVIYNTNEDIRHKKLFSLSDDEIATLSSKEIKKIRKSYKPKINFKSKGKHIKWRGTQLIKITGTGDFYIEEMLQVKRKEGKYTTEKTFISFTIPYNNRKFLIMSECVEEFCEGIKERMAKIIEPTFKINPSGITTYDFQKKQDMIELLERVKGGYKILRIARLLMFLV